MRCSTPSFPSNKPTARFPPPLRIPALKAQKCYHKREMATYSESSSSAHSPIFNSSSSTSRSIEALPAEDSPLAGLINTPINIFNGIRQVKKLVASRSNELQAGRTNEQYLVFLHVKNNQLAKIDHKRASIGKHIRMTHHTDTNELIVKLMPSGKHESAHLSLAQELIYELIHIGISRENLLAPVGGIRCSGPSSSKEADSAYKPLSRRQENGWPTIVFESGLSEGLTRLRVDARWWLINSGGEVNIVIIISIKPSHRYLQIEKWCLAPAANLPITRANSNPNAQVPTKIQEICVTQNPANPIQPGTTAPCSVAGGSLVLEFHSLYLRAPVAPEGDVILTTAILSAWANRFWDSNM